MSKLTIFVSLMFIATWSQAICKREKKDVTASDHFAQGTILGAGTISCDSCGNECVSACGTKHFRSCCFNYLKKKRSGPENDSTKLHVRSPMFWLTNYVDADLENYPKSNLPYYIAKNIPEQMISNLISDEYKPYFFEDNIDNRWQEF